MTSTRAGTFTARALSIPGVTATVSPRTLAFTGAGQSKSFTVTFTRTTAALDEFATGYLSWVGGGTTVRSPVAVRPVTVDAPTDASGTGISGSTKVTVTPGFTGNLPLELAGLSTGVLQKDPKGSSADHSAAGSTGASFSWEVTVPEGTAFARFDEKAVDQTADLDLTVELLDEPGGSAVAAYQSATSAADERVDIPDPEPGTYRATVDVYSATTAFDLNTFAVAGTGVGALTATPNPLPVTQGTPTSYTLSWSGLAPRTSYVGVVTYGDSGTYTILQVASGEPPAPVNTAKPAITGTALVGRTLTATPGTWDVAGLTYAYQWQVAGVDVAGATAPTYVVRAADEGKAVTVRVTASKSGLADGTATSDPVTVKYTAKVALRLSPSFSFNGNGVRAQVAVTAGTVPTGDVSVTVHGKTVRGTLGADGRTTLRLPNLPGGVYAVKVSYLGSATVAPAVSPTRYLVVLF